MAKKKETGGDNKKPNKQKIGNEIPSTDDQTFGMDTIKDTIEEDDPIVNDPVIGVNNPPKNEIIKNPIKGDTPVLDKCCVGKCPCTKKPILCRILSFFGCKCCKCKCRKK